MPKEVQFCSSEEKPPQKNGNVKSKWNIAKCLPGAPFDIITYNNSSKQQEAVGIIIPNINGKINTCSKPPTSYTHGPLNVPIFHITQPLGIWSFLWLLFWVMSNIPKMGQLPTPDAGPKSLEFAALLVSLVASPGSLPFPMLPCLSFFWVSLLHWTTATVAFRFSRSCARRALESERLKPHCANSCRFWSWTMEYLWNIYRIEYIYIWKILYIQCCTKTGGLWDFSSKARERWGLSRNAHVHWTWLNTISAGTH